MAARDPRGEKYAPGSRAAVFYLVDFFRVSLDGLSESGTTRSLSQEFEIKQLLWQSSKMKLTK